MIAAYIVLLLFNTQYEFVPAHTVEIISAAVAVATFLGFVLRCVVTMALDMFADALYREHELAKEYENAGCNEQ
jgi:hypothetical protein